MTPLAAPWCRNSSNERADPRRPSAGDPSSPPKANPRGNGIVGSASARGLDAGKTWTSERRWGARAALYNLTPDRHGVTLTGNSWQSGATTASGMMNDKHEL